MKVKRYKRDINIFKKKNNHEMNLLLRIVNFLFVIYFIGCFRFTTFSKVSKVYTENMIEFEMIKDSLIYCEPFKMIIRITCDESSKYPFGNCEEISYSFSVVNDKINKSFEVSIIDSGKFNEDFFWDRNFNEIIDYTGKINLKQFLEENGISVNLFKIINTFLRKYNLYSIMKYNAFIIYNFSSNAGLIFDSSNSDILPKYGSPSEIKKIDKNWYYFRSYEN